MSKKWLTCLIAAMMAMASASAMSACGITPAGSSSSDASTSADNSSESTGDESTGDESTGDESTGDESTGDESTGDDSTGDDSTGDDSTGGEVTPATYTVTFAGADVAEQTIDENGKVVKPADPVKDHYTFDGWYNGEVAWDFETDTVTEAITLTAKFTAKTYTVKFVDFDGNETEATYTIENKDEFTLPAVPAAPQYYENATWNKTVEECVVFAEEAIVVTAVADVKTYTVQFVDFDGSVTEVTYTIENKDEFALPAVPATPEHYENARWNKTVEECVVFADEVIVVEAIADAKIYAVAFNAMGGSEVETQNVAYGKTITPVASKLEGYVFNGWKLNGEAYAISTPVAGDITLVASWAKVVEGGEKTELSAEYIYNNTVYEVGYGSQYKTEAEPSPQYHYDSDYSGRTGAGGGIAANQFKEWAIFGLTADGGAGTVEEGRETYLVLPAINYQLYSKVDFAYKNNGNIKSLVVNGVDFKEYGGSTKQISIITDETGTYLILRELNCVDIDGDNQARVQLPESVANGLEGLKLNISVKTWVGFSITEFHVTSRTVDYTANMATALAKLPENASDLTYSAEEIEATLLYIENEAYLTEAELVGYTTPAVIEAAKEGVFYNAVINAETGSWAQVEAIEAYRAYTATLTEQQKAAEQHQANVAAINAIIEANFKKTVTTAVENKAIIQATGTSINTQHYDNKSYWGGGIKTEFQTGDYTEFNLAQFAEAETAYNATFTLPKFNFMQYDEVYFGIAAVTAKGDCTVSVAGASYSYDLNTSYVYAKAVVKGSALTIIGDGAKNAGQVLATAELSQAVLTGEEALVITWTTAGWSQVEVSEIQTQTVSVTIAGAIENSTTNRTADGNFGGEQNVPPVDGSASKFKGKGYGSFSYITNTSGANNAAITLTACDYSKHEEVYFGVAMAVVGSQAGTITINGETMTMPTSLIGHFYVMKAVVKDGYIIFYDDGSTNDVKSRATGFAENGYFFKAKLSDSVLNGSEALTIDFGGLDGQYSWLEVTEMQTITVVNPIA